jgi:hypothetical protein
MASKEPTLEGTNDRLSGTSDQYSLFTLLKKQLEHTVKEDQNRTTRSNTQLS